MAPILRAADPIASYATGLVGSDGVLHKLHSSVLGGHGCELVLSVQVQVQSADDKEGSYSKHNPSELQHGELQEFEVQQMTECVSKVFIIKQGDRGA